MKNLLVVFGYIKNYCAETGLSNEQCFAELEKLEINNSIFFPLFSYLRVLQSLGLIKLSKFRKVVTLTKKGRNANEYLLHSLLGYAVLYAHYIRRAVIVTVMFTLFWPVFMAIQRQHHHTGTNAGLQVRH